MTAPRAIRRCQNASCLVILLALTLPALTGCPGAAGHGAGGADKSGGRLKVVCTTTMIADLAENLVGDWAVVQGVMKPGEDPHVYDVRPRDAELLADADLVLLNGHHLEATLGHIIENNAHGKVVALAELAVADPISAEGGQGAPDPHCWMSVPNFRGYVQHARDALIEVDPEHAQQYRQNSDRYLAQLDELHNWVVQQVGRVPRERRVMVTSHDAFEYLGRQYKIEVHGMIGISTEQAPRPQDIEQLEALIRERDVRALFIETSVTQTLNELVKKTAAATSVKIGGTLYSDSLGDKGSPGGTYVGMMRHNISTIVEALQ